MPQNQHSSRSRTSNVGAPIVIVTIKEFGPFSRPILFSLQSHYSFPSSLSKVEGHDAFNKLGSGEHVFLQTAVVNRQPFRRYGRFSASCP